MKSNITLNSKDRVLYGITIRQDTKNQFLSLTDLQEAYTVERINKGWTDRRIERILSTNDSAERIYYILFEQGMIRTQFGAFMKDVENNSLVKVMKSCGAYKTKGRGTNRTTMCNPYIWVMIAMELNPELYAKVIIWLTDDLIINRIEAGDRYNELCRACGKFKDVDYRLIARGLNYIIFNEHEVMIRNKATQSELKELDDLQKSLAFSVNMNFIKSFDDLHSVMVKLWKDKWGNNQSNITLIHPDCNSII